MDRDHDIDRCFTVTERVLHMVFNELFDARVQLEGIVLKPNMVISGKSAPSARRSRKFPAVTVLKLCVPGPYRDRLPVRRTD